jgi:hypothetical protein
MFVMMVPLSDVSRISQKEYSMRHSITDFLLFIISMHNDDLVQVIRVTCHICGWNVRFPSETKVESFIHTLHKKQQGEGHEFNGVISHYFERKEFIVFNSML